MSTATGSLRSTSRSNLESVLTYEGTPEMHTRVIGQAITGEQAFG